MELVGDRYIMLDFCRAYNVRVLGENCDLCLQYEHAGIRSGYDYADRRRDPWIRASFANSDSMHDNVRRTTPPIVGFTESDSRRSVGMIGKLASWLAPLAVSACTPDAGPRVSSRSLNLLRASLSHSGPMVVVLTQSHAAPNCAPKFRTTCFSEMARSGSLQGTDWPRLTMLRLYKHRRSLRIPLRVLRRAVRVS